MVWDDIAQFSQDAWDWTKGAGSTIYDYGKELIGAGDERMVKDDQFDRYLRGEYQADPAAYDPLGTEQGAEVYSGYSDMAGQGARDYNSTTAAYEGSIGPVDMGTLYGAPTVNAQAVDPTLQRFDAASGLEADSRGYQIDQLGALEAMAAGNGPSAAEEMARRGAIDLERAYGTAGIANAESIQRAQYGADLGYGDALAQQQLATLQGGREAQRAILAGNRRALLNQSAMAAAARGGDQGLARRQAMQQAALMGAGANAQAAGAFQDTQLQAAANSAAAQRAAYTGQLQSNAQAGSAYQQALMQGAGAYESAMSQGIQARSQEQLAAMGLYMDATGQIRQMDQASAEMALGADQAALDVMVGNAGRDLTAQQATASNALATNQLNAGVEQDYYARDIARQQANQANRGANQDRALSQQQAGMQGQAGLVGMQTTSQQAGQNLGAQQHDAGRDRALDYDSSVRGGVNAEQDRRQRARGALVASLGSAASQYATMGQGGGGGGFGG